MSGIKGEVRFTVEGVEHTLAPSLNAFTRLSTSFENYGTIIDKVSKMHAPTMAHVLRLGLGWNDDQAKKIPALMFRAGISNLAEPLVDYVFRLFNCGQSVDEFTAENAAKLNRQVNPEATPDVADAP